MIEQLNHILLAKHTPNVYDGDAMTMLDLLTKVLGKTNECIAIWNEFEVKINDITETFIKSQSNDFDLYKMEINQAFDDFIKVIKLNIDAQQSNISDQNQKLEANVDYVNRSIEEFREFITVNLHQYAVDRLDEIAAATYSAMYIDKASEEIGYRAMLDSKYDVTYDGEIEEVAMTVTIQNNANESSNYEMIQALSNRVQALENGSSGGTNGTNASYSSTDEQLNV